MPEKKRSHPFVEIRETGITSYYKWASKIALRAMIAFGLTGIALLYIFIYLVENASLQDKVLWWSGLSLAIAFLFLHAFSLPPQKPYLVQHEYDTYHHDD